MKISEINVYPVKSLKGIPLNESFVERRGLRFDRRWMLVDKNGVFLTQRDFPPMAAIGVSLWEGFLRVSADGFEDLLVPLEPKASESVTVRIWQNTCAATAIGEDADRWFTDVLRSGCRIVYLPDESDLQVKSLYNLGNDQVSFADGFPLLVTVENSLAYLSEKAGRTFPMNRFRPNLVVSGADAFAEDRWKKIRIGETVFRVAKPSERCVVTTIDQDLGVAAGKEPMETLVRYRTAGDVFRASCDALGLRKNAVVFGENLIAENPGKTINVGDALEIIEFRD